MERTCLPDDLHHRKDTGEPQKRAHDAVPCRLSLHGNLPQDDFTVRFVCGIPAGLERRNAVELREKLFFRHAVLGYLMDVL